MMFMSNDTPYMKILSIYLYANLVYYIGGLLNAGLGFILMEMALMFIQV